MPEAKLRLNRGETGRRPLAADVRKQRLSRPIPFGRDRGNHWKRVGVMPKFDGLLAWGPEAPDRSCRLGLGNRGPEPAGQVYRSGERGGRTRRANEAGERDGSSLQGVPGDLSMGQEEPCPWLRSYPSLLTSAAA